MPWTLMCVFVFSTHAAIASPLEGLEKWRKERFASLSAPHGWMSQIALQWLLPGENEVPLPRGKNRVLKVNYRPAVQGRQAAVELQPIQRSFDPLEKDESVELDGFLIQVLKREHRVGIRIRDPQSPTRKNIKTLHWFPPSERWVVAAVLEPFKDDRWITVQDSSQQEQRLKAVGRVNFKIENRELSLLAFEGESGLFIPFRDRSSGVSTYAAARFLDASRDGSRVVLDFNRAYNPPCAYTRFATCPYPPAENHLPIEITAGEKKPPRGTHSSK